MDIRRRPVVQAVLCVAAGLAGCTGKQINATADKVVHKLAPRPPSHWINVLKTSKDPDLRRTAYLKLSRPELYTDAPELGETVVSLYGLALKAEKEVYVRAVAARCLGHFATPKALEALRYGTADPAASVRVDACASVGAVRQPGGVDLLAGVLKDDPKADVRLAAAEALARYPTRRSIRALIPGLSDKDIATRRRVRLSLESITAQQLGDQPEPWRKHLQAHLDDFPDHLDVAIAFQRARQTPARKWYWLWLF